MAVPTAWIPRVTRGCTLWFGGSRNGGAKSTVPDGPVWWWLYMICGYHSRYMIREMFSVSGCVTMYESTVVVVPDILLVEPRDTPCAPLRRVWLTHVPARHELHSVRVRVHQQGNRVVEKAKSLGVVEAHHLIRHLHELRCPEDLGGVEPPVDPHDGLGGLRQLARFVVAEVVRQGQALCVPLVLGEIR